MSLQQLIYISQSTSAFSGETLETLAKQAQRNNALTNITGLLLYSEGCFMQLLEGEAEILEDLYTKIQTDSRHENLQILLFQSIEDRHCPHWDMAVVNVEKSAPDIKSRAQQRMRLLLDIPENSDEKSQYISELIQIFLIPEIHRAG